jgi:hypothetical protein
LEDPGIDKRIIIKIDLGEIGWASMDWSVLAEDEDVMVDHLEHSNKPLHFIKCGTFLGKAKCLLTHFVS